MHPVQIPVHPVHVGEQPVGVQAVAEELAGRHRHQRGLSLGGFHPIQPGVEFIDPVGMEAVLAVGLSLVAEVEHEYVPVTVQVRHKQRICSPK